VRLTRTTSPSDGPSDHIALDLRLRTVISVVTRLESVLPEQVISEGHSQQPSELGISSQFKNSDCLVRILTTLSIPQYGLPFIVPFDGQIQSRREMSRNYSRTKLLLCTRSRRYHDLVKRNDFDYLQDNAM